MGTASWVYCWGNMSYGAFKTLSTTDQNFALEGPNGKAHLCKTDPCNLDGDKAEIMYINKIVSGERHTCTLMNDNPSTLGVSEDGQIICWGDNSFGQVGVSNNSGLEITNFNYWGRVVMSGSQPLIAKDIIAGKEFTCAITKIEEKLFCWGRNNQKQISDSTTQTYLIPTLMEKPHYLYFASKNGEHSVGTTTNGTTIIWGKNNQKQVANTTNSPESNTTENIESLDGALGSEFSCFLNYHNEDINYVQCKGRGNNGQLGRGNSTDSPILSPVLSE